LATFSWQDKKKYARASGAETGISETGNATPILSPDSSGEEETETLVSAVDRRAYFLLFRQKKVAKEKATPRYAAGVAGYPALLARPGGCATRAVGPQTVLADIPRPRSVARRCTRGNENRSGTTVSGRKTTWFSRCPLRRRAAQAATGKKARTV
jgi:hypothetical protein